LRATLQLYDTLLQVLPWPNRAGRPPFLYRSLRTSIADAGGEPAHHVVGESDAGSIGLATAQLDDLLDAVLAAPASAPASTSYGWSVGLGSAVRSAGAVAVAGSGTGSAAGSTGTGVSDGAGSV
jgi:hypothetical protein